MEVNVGSISEELEQSQQGIEENCQRLRRDIYESY